jgi:pyruvate formate lyase activating enzyme
MASTRTILEIAKRTDLFLYDLKLMDSERHKHWTGVGNGRILHNLEALARTRADIQVRIPLIKGVNCDVENIEATAAFVASLSGAPNPVSLLPYHNLAEGKSAKLGKKYDAGMMTEPGEEELARIVEQFSQHGLVAKLGG